MWCSSHENLLWLIMILLDYYYYYYYYYYCQYYNYITLMKIMSTLTLLKLMNKGVLDNWWILNLLFTFYRSRKLRLLFAVICLSFSAQTLSKFWHLSERSLLCVVKLNILSSTSALDAVGWSTPRPDRFIPGKESRYPLCRGLGGHHGSVPVRKIPPSTMIRSLALSSRSESL